ncbi:hypothetical protein JOQ06_021318, partial [Pogonophryne albipinna]
TAADCRRRHRAMSYDCELGLVLGRWAVVTSAVLALPRPRLHGDAEFVATIHAEAQPERREPVLIPLSSNKGRFEQISPPRLEEHIPFIPLTSPVYLSTLPESTSNPSTPPPKPARRGKPCLLDGVFGEDRGSPPERQRSHLLSLMMLSRCVSGEALTPIRPPCRSPPHHPSPP